MATEEEATAVKNRHSARLRSLPGVSGVGVEKRDSDFVITLLVDRDNLPQEALLPRQIEGVRVDIVPSGPFRKS
jgi:hypothetical protein